MAKNRRRNQRRLNRATGTETELQRLAREVMDQQADQSAALADLQRIRSGHSEAALSAALAVARHADRIDQLHDLAAAGQGWAYLRQGGIWDAIDEAEREVAAMMTAQTLEWAADRAIAAIDRLIVASPGKDRAGASGATPEMRQRIRAGDAGDPVAALVRLHHLDADDKRDLEELARIWRYVEEGRGMRTMDFGVKPEPCSDDVAATRRDYDFFGLLHARVYAPWWRRAGLGGRIALDLAVSGDSLDTIRRRNRIGWATAANEVQRALRLYRDIRRRGMAAAA